MSPMVAASHPRFTEREYLALEAVAEETRHEFSGGEIIAMAGAEPDHNQIVQNIRLSLGNQVLDRDCRVLGGDQRVKVEAIGEYFYPDVLMLCQPPVYVEPGPRSLVNPELIVEVLSRSTESKDRSSKWLAYQSIPSLQEYLLVSTTARRIERYQRQGDAWLLTSTEAGTLELHEGLSLSLDAVYRLTDL